MQYLNFEDYLESMMSCEQVRILRICLRTGAPIHVIGCQGSGKSCLVDGLRKLGFRNITEPYSRELLQPDTIPMEKEGLVVLLLKDSKAYFPIDEYPSEVFQRFREDIVDWVYGLGNDDLRM